MKVVSTRIMETPLDLVFPALIDRSNKMSIVSTSNRCRSFPCVNKTDSLHYYPFSLLLPPKRNNGSQASQVSNQTHANKASPANIKSICTLLSVRHEA